MSKPEAKDWWASQGFHDRDFWKFSLDDVLLPQSRKSPGLNSMTGEQSDEHKHHSPNRHLYSTKEHWKTRKPLDFSTLELEPTWYNAEMFWGQNSLLFVPTSI